MRGSQSHPGQKRSPGSSSPARRRSEVVGLTAIPSTSLAALASIGVEDSSPSALMSPQGGHRLASLDRASWRDRRRTARASGRRTQPFVGSRIGCPSRRGRRRGPGPRRRGLRWQGRGVVERLWWAPRVRDGRPHRSLRCETKATASPNRGRALAPGRVARIGICRPSWRGGGYLAHDIQRADMFGQRGGAPLRGERIPKRRQSVAGVVAATHPWGRGAIERRWLATHRAQVHFRWPDDGGDGPWTFSYRLLS